jgi:hypothetical protein
MATSSTESRLSWRVDFILEPSLDFARQPRRFPRNLQCRRWLPLPSIVDLAMIGTPTAFTQNGKAILRSCSICFDLTFRPVRIATSSFVRNVSLIQSPMYSAFGVTHQSLAILRAGNRPSWATEAKCWSGALARRTPLRPIPLTAPGAAVPPAGTLWLVLLVLAASGASRGRCGPRPGHRAAAAALQLDCFRPCTHSSAHVEVAAPALSCKRP